jgi:superfamily I DNA/RNA helicase
MMKNNVIGAIEAIDEGGFLATTKSDKQFLDVETLHGWCMRELKADTGGIDYALHPDAIASKKKQDEILRNVVDKAIQTRLERNKTLLSSDLLSHFEGPRDRLIANLRHEIAIRIKGRGMRTEQKLYVDSPLKSFVGRRENRHDRYFVFKIAEEYGRDLFEIGRLDTDDVVLSMQSRLAAPLWDVQRKVAGYDFVFVDETHLFNENERRVLPYLTRGSQEYLPIIMTFDEAQSIGGRRSDDLERVGILRSEQRSLNYVHRSSKEIYRLARDLVERSSLVFSEFSGSESVPRMSERDMLKCLPPALVFVDGDAGIAAAAANKAIALKTKNYQRVGIIAFDNGIINLIGQYFDGKPIGGKILTERGDSIAGRPLPGIFVMNAENCGGLEFDAVILVGVDQGRVPPSLHNISPEGHMSVREESCKELYTALTRARYHVTFICDGTNGASEFLSPWIESGAIEET